MKRHIYSWEDLSTDIKLIVKQISLSGWSPDFIVGVKKGGIVPASILSFYMDLPILFTSLQEKNEKIFLNEVNESLKGKRLLIVNDIWYEEKMLHNLMKKMISIGLTDLRSCSVFYNTMQKEAVDFWGRKIDKSQENFWIVFPWSV